jgi:hypothetical protein
MGLRGTTSVMHRNSSEAIESTTIVITQVQNASGVKILTQRYGRIQQYSTEVYLHLFQSNHSVESKSSPVKPNKEQGAFQASRREPHSQIQKLAKHPLLAPSAVI